MAGDQHQKLMSDLSIINKRIAAQEQHMKKKKGKLSPSDWEKEVRIL